MVGDVQQIYEEYLTQAEQLEQNRRIGDGLFGFGNAPADDPCHDRFAHTLETELQRLLTQPPTAEEARDILAYIYRAPLQSRSIPSAYWMLLAVHGLTVDVIGLLSPPVAKDLYAWYEQTYPRRERLPVQKQVLAALKSASQAV